MFRRTISNVDCYPNSSVLKGRFGIVGGGLPQTVLGLFPFNFVN